MVTNQITRKAYDTAYRAKIPRIFCVVDSFCNKVFKNDHNCSELGI
mgnify:CR=1 FL=1